MNYAIETEGLTKKFGTLIAVDHVSIKVEKGEIFGYLGPNGAGKTTTIRMLTGVSTSSEGHAFILGHHILNDSINAKALMGIVPDVSNIYEELSAWDNLVFTGRLYGIAKAEIIQRSTELLKRFNLFDRRHEKVKKFSKGMKRKICIAMALINDAEILFLDEPTTGLDVETVHELHQLIRSFSDEKLTIFLTTHNLEEASTLCDRIAIINQGKIIAVDTPEALRQLLHGIYYIEVAFRRTPENLSDYFSQLPEVIAVKKRGDKYQIHTNNLPPLLREFWHYVNESNYELLSINTFSPSLEDVFLQLVNTHR